MGGRHMTITAELCRIEAMSGPFGATAKGIDLSRVLAPDVFLRIARALRDHHILRIPDQNLTVEQFAAFARFWGRPIDFFDLDYCLDGNPNVLLIHNREDSPA